MKGFTKGTRLDISKLAKSEMDRLKLTYADLVNSSGISLSHIKNAIHYNSITIKADVYIKILSCLKIDVELLYSKRGIEFYYKKEKAAK